MNQARERKSLRFESRQRDNGSLMADTQDVNIYDELRSSLHKFKLSENKSEESQNSDDNDNQ